MAGRTGGTSAPCVRAATAADMPALDRLYCAVIGAAGWLPTAARTAGSFADAAAGERVFVTDAGAADRAGGSAGLAGVIAVEADKAFVHHLYVAEDRRRQGVGAALLASLDLWLPRPWHLKCVSANRPALAFYAALGWIDVGAGVGAQGPYRLLEFGAGLSTAAAAAEVGAVGEAGERAAAHSAGKAGKEVIEPGAAGG